MEIYYRKKPTTSIKGTVRFQILSWYTYDKEINDDEFDLEYKIYAFGVSEKGESVCVEINDYTPFFYARIPEDLQETWTDFKTLKVKSYLKNRLYRFRESLMKVSLVEKKDLDGFTNEKFIKFLKIIVSNEKTFTKCKYILAPGGGRSLPKIEGVNKAPISFKLYEANIEPFIRFCHIQDIKLSGWCEVSKFSEEDNSRCQIDIACRWRNILPIDIKNVSKMYIISFDIETYSAKGQQMQKNIFPDPNEPNDIITQIGNTLHIYGTSNKIECCFTINSKQDNYVKEQEGIITYAFDTEKEMLKAWIQFIKKTDPDIMTGYNINNFDWEYIYIRAKYLELEPDLQYLSRLYDKPAYYKQDKLITNAYGENIFKYISAPGILNSDLYTIIKREKKLPSYKLNYVAQEYIGDQKDDLKALDLFNMSQGTAQEIATVIHYCVKDCTLVINLILKLCIITNNVAMANVTWVPIEYIESKGQQIKVHSQLAYEARLNNYLVPTIPYKDAATIDEEAEKFTGATVQEAEPGAHFEQISGLDFASLYPSIMIANNFSYETILKDKRYDNLPDIEYKNIEWTEDANTPTERFESVRFVQNRKGILPIILDKLWTQRKAIKKDMKNVKNELSKATDQEEIDKMKMYYDVLDGFQLAMKVSMNSIYGFTGANLGRLPEKRIAASVTAEGRRMIQACKEYVEGEYDCKVVYGDSVAHYTPIYIMKNTVKRIIRIEELEQICAEPWKPCEDGPNGPNGPGGPGGPGDTKEYLEFSNHDLFTWSSSGWTHLKRVIRHKLVPEKKMLRIYTKAGLVDVTDDHSLLLSDRTVISPKNLNYDSYLLTKKINEPLQQNKKSYMSFTFMSQFDTAKEFQSAQSEGYNVELKYNNGVYTVYPSNTKDISSKVIRIEEIEYNRDKYVYDLTTRNSHFAAGIGNLIVHNTDSIYVKFFTKFEGQEHMDEVFRLSEVAAEGCSQLFKKPVEMEFEKVMWPFILFSKKRYACVVWTNQHKHDYIDYKGIQVVRRDNCPYVKERSMEIFETILLERNIEKAITMGRGFSRNLLEGKVNIKDLIISKSLKGYGSYEFDKQVLCEECDKRWYKEEGGKKVYKIPMLENKPLEESIKAFIKQAHYCYTCKKECNYKTNRANIPHVALARMMKERDPYNCPQVGERVPYVFKKVNNQRALQFERVEDPEYLTQNCIPIDFDYYFEHQFKSAIETIFYPILKEMMNEKMFQGIVEEKVKRTRKIK